MIEFSRLRIQLVDHPGALAAATRALASYGLNIVEVSIHEVDGDQAVDEIVASAEFPIDDAALGRALVSAGAQLLSMAPCETRVDPVVTALTWVAASAERPGARGALAAGVQMLTGISPVRVLAAADAERVPIGAAALRRGFPLVERTDQLLNGMVAESGTAPRWVLAAPDAPAGSYVVFAARPYSIRFTATELSRLAAVLDCRRQLMAALSVPLPSTLPATSVSA